MSKDTYKRKSVFGLRIPEKKTVYHDRKHGNHWQAGKAEEKAKGKQDETMNSQIPHPVVYFLQQDHTS